MNKDKN